MLTFLQPLAGQANPLRTGLTPEDSCWRGSLRGNSQDLRLFGEINSASPSVRPPPPSQQMYHSRFTQHGLSLQPAINAVKAGNRTQQDLECILHEKMGPVDVDHNAKRRMWPSFPSPLKSVTSVKLAKSAASTSKIRTDAGQGLGTEEVSELCTCKDCQKLLPVCENEVSFDDHVD